MKLFDDSEIKKRVFVAWNETFTVSNRILQQAKVYGFTLMEVIPDPNIHQMITSLQAVEHLFDKIIDSPMFPEMDYDQSRIVLNTREQIRKMEDVALALQREDRVMFDAAIAALEKQAVF